MGAGGVFESDGVRSHAGIWLGHGYEGHQSLKKSLGAAAILETRFLVQFLVPGFGFEFAFRDPHPHVADGRLHDGFGFEAAAALMLGPQFHVGAFVAAVSALGAMRGEDALVGPQADGAGVDADDFGRGFEGDVVGLVVEWSGCRMVG